MHPVSTTLKVETMFEYECMTCGASYSEQPENNFCDNCGENKVYLTDKMFGIEEDEDDDWFNRSDVRYGYER